MTYCKPYYWNENERSYKDVILWRSEERKTDSFIFMKGRHLPFDSKDPRWPTTIQDPKDYDLIFHSEVLPERFTSYDVLPNNCPAPLVNAKVKHLLETLCLEDVQFFPATVVPAKPKMESFENHDYWVLNICSLYEDVDFEQSETNFREISKDKPPIQSGYKRVIFKELTGQKIPHIGRLIYSKSSIIVSPELVKIFKKEKIKGVRFTQNSEHGDRL